MLKTLRVTSVIAVIAAAVGVVAIIFLGLKGDPQIKALLAKQGIVEQLKKKASQQGEKEEPKSPLVAQAKLIALRFDPPPPPAPPKPKGPVTPPKELAREVKKPPIPQPKVQTQVKSNLLATVVYESAPDRSLALLQTSGNKQEWFRQGEKVGHLEIQEVRDGSVVFTQGGRNPQEKFVPAKPQAKSLLKGEGAVSAASRPGSDSIMVQLPASGQEPAAGSAAASTPKSAATATTDSGKVRMVRQGRPDVATRIQKARSTPRPKTPQEQKESLTGTMSGIEAIMNRQDESVSGKDRKKENEMWLRLMKELNSEKEKLEAMAPVEESSEKDADNSPAEEPKKEPRKKQDSKTSAPADPNETKDR